MFSPSKIYCLFILFAIFISWISSFQLPSRNFHKMTGKYNRIHYPTRDRLDTSVTTLHLLEFDDSTTTYVGLFALTLIPSLLLVKFVGDRADDSRGTLSEKTQNEFKRKMMQQPNLNLSLPTNEEEALKKQIAKAYMQDKDVDVAVLEEKLRQRAQWRKEVMAQKREQSLNASSDDDDGW